VSNMTVTPNSIANAARAIVAKHEARGEETQVFFAELGAVVLTDNEAYEVYAYDEGIIIQCRDMDRADGWRDVTGYF